MKWQTSRFQIDLGTPRVMGIVNVTPDSFSDAGRSGTTASALRQFADSYAKTFAEQAGPLREAAKAITPMRAGLALAGAGLGAAHAFHQRGAGQVDKARARLGLGRVGPVSPIERAALLAKVRSALAIDHLLVAGSMEGEVTRVAVGAGACGDLLNEVIASGAGLYVTGEMRHHDALRAAAAGVTVACALHSNSERRTLAVLAGRLRAALPGLNVLLSSADRDPFRVAG